MVIALSATHDPAANLALEQRLLRDEQRDFLLLYINSDSVITGRNQAVEAEADCAFCFAHGIPVLKRASGGGTVWHDLGNVNWAFIRNKGPVALLDSDPTRPVRDALASMGIAAQVGPRGELTVDGKKISGTASYVASRRELFHGTLLFESNLQTMERALRGDGSKRGKKVASVPSEVVNLNGLLPEMTAEGFMRRLAEFFRNYYGAETILTY